MPKFYSNKNLEPVAKKKFKNRVVELYLSNNSLFKNSSDSLKNVLEQLGIHYATNPDNDVFPRDNMLMNEDGTPRKLESLQSLRLVADKYGIDLSELDSDLKNDPDKFLQIAVAFINDKNNNHNIDELIEIANSVDKDMFNEAFDMLLIMSCSEVIEALGIDVSVAKDKKNKKKEKETVEQQQLESASKDLAEDFSEDDLEIDADGIELDDIEEIGLDDL